MTDEQIKIAIAKACGWTAEQDSNGYWRAVNQKHGNAVELWLSEQNVWSVGIPDYLNDLNAMHDAEKVLLTKDGFCGCWETYSNILTASMGCTDIFHATAAQRAEAFLKTLGLWEDGE